MEDETTEPTCQDLQKAIKDFTDAVNDWVLRRQIIRWILEIIAAILPGWPTINPDTATNAELDAWVEALLTGQHACTSVLQSGGS